MCILNYKWQCQQDVIAALTINAAPHRIADQAIIESRSFQLPVQAKRVSKTCLAVLVLMLALKVGRASISSILEEAFPPEICKVIYTTNAIESVNMSLRKITKNRGSFPSDEALSKLFYLALRNISQKWNMPIRVWKAALNRFSIEFEDRVPHQ